MKINSAVASLIRVLLVSAFLVPPGLAQQPQPTASGSSAQTDKIESKIRKIGIRADVTVKLNNGKTYHGFINRIDDEEFEMGEVDLKTSIVVRYDQVKKVESGYGAKGPLGNRVGKKGRRIGTIISVAALVIPFILVASTIRE
jgi:hypothetical protein